MDRDVILKQMRDLAESTKLDEEIIVKVVVSRDMWDEVNASIDGSDWVDYKSATSLVLNGVEVRVDDMLPEKSYWPFRRKDLRAYEDIYKIGTKFKMPG